ncbi:xanthine dehydrogenase subunit XdhA [Limisalsivibrio acetivorans]|uniref:xanthine dehydrogenase subunit XdhA n=1 Tax=Limisalsivibrio acetivorans TaxID=1304888 RepID=UPI0003B7A106|nr:xanthine dehydrogenase subunit XdhA [Limisalsivibrio acetivorans]
MSVGKNVQRQDAVAKVTGRARYTEDLPMSGMKHAVYVRSTIAHGIVKSINFDKAKGVKGVRAVFTYEDVPDIFHATAGHPYAYNREQKDVEDRLLLTKHVRFEGDEIAVIVADSEMIARKAARLVEVEYEELEPLITPENILREDAPKIHDTGNIVGAHSFEVGGSLDDATDSSDYIAEGDYKTAMVQHCHLENHVAYAYMEDNDTITVVSSTQIPHIARRIISEALEFPLGRVKVVKPYIGGGFGSKQDTVLEPMVAFLTTKLGGKPVQMNLTREECLSCSRTRHPFYGHVRAGADKDGRLTFLDVDAVSLTGAYASHGHAIISAGSAKSCAMYPRSVIKVNAKTVYSNMPVAGAMRAYGTPQIVFMVENAVEELAANAGIDPLEFRLKNVGVPGDINPLKKSPMLSHGLKECLEKGRELFDWDRKRKEYKAYKKGSVRKGIGVACFSYASGTYPGNVEIAGARAVLNQDGSVHIQVGATEIGQGSDTAFAQMAAESSGIDVGMIKVISTQDTDFSPFDTGAYASRQTYVTGQAVHKAALEFRGKILNYAEDLTGVIESRLMIDGDRIVYTTRPDVTVVTMKELAIHSYYHKDLGGQISAEVSYKTRTNALSFGCTFVDIDIDIELCKVKINDIINIHDSGRIINPLLAEGQVHGGMAMSIGAALSEELLIDEKSGRVYNNSLLDYKIPTMMDIPDMRCGFVETEEPTAGYGNKSLGEPPIISPAPALRNAILDATGVAVSSLPMSPKSLYVEFTKAGLI